MGLSERAWMIWLLKYEECQRLVPPELTWDYVKAENITEVQVSLRYLSCGTLLYLLK